DCERASHRAEPARGLLAGARGDDLAIARRSLRHERVDQAPGHDRDLVNGLVEDGLIGLRRFREAAELADELQRRCPDLLVGRGRIEVEERLDVSAHGEAPAIARSYLQGARVLTRATRHAILAAVVRRAKPPDHDREESWSLIRRRVVAAMALVVCLSA